MFEGLNFEAGVFSWRGWFLAGDVPGISVCFKGLWGVSTCLCVCIPLVTLKYDCICVFKALPLTGVS